MEIVERREAMKVMSRHSMRSNVEMIIGLELVLDENEKFAHRKMANDRVLSIIVE